MYEIIQEYYRQWFYSHSKKTIEQSIEDTSPLAAFYAGWEACMKHLGNVSGIERNRLLRKFQSGE